MPVPPVTSLGCVVCPEDPSRRAVEGAPHPPRTLRGVPGEASFQTVAWATSAPGATCTPTWPLSPPQAQPPAALQKGTCCPRAHRATLRYPGMSASSLGLGSWPRTGSRDQAEELSVPMGMLTALGGSRGRVQGRGTLEGGCCRAGPLEPSSLGGGASLWEARAPRHRVYELRVHPLSHLRARAGACALHLEEQPLALVSFYCRDLGSRRGRGCAFIGCGAVPGFCVHL